jgi:hypothetical protein
MPRYSVYVNAGIEISAEVEAENEKEAEQKAYDMIGHREYECTIEVEEI